MMKRIIAFLLVFCLFGVSANAQFIYENELDEVLGNLMEDIEEPTVSQTYGDWSVIAMSQSGYDAGANYFDGYKDRAEEFLQNGSTRKYTDYAIVHLALLSLGKNPTGAEVFLHDKEMFKRQGVTGCAYALIAKNNSGDNTEYLNYILQNQHTDGGWGLAKASDGDVTAIVLQALSRYTDKNVDEAIKRGLDYLDGISIEYSETAAQIVIAMCDLGISPYPMAEKLMTFYKDGYFSHTQDGEINQMSTEQGSLALTALYKYERGETLFPSPNKTNSLYNTLENTKMILIMRNVLKIWGVVIK